MIRTVMPEKLVAGDTWRLQREYSNYAPGTWTVTFYFENQTKQFSQAAATSGTGFLMTIDATTSAALPAGRYRWYARAVAGAIVETIEGEDGWIEVLPNPAAAGARDLRSFARRALDAVQAAIEGKASSAQQSFAIANRSVSSYTLDELWNLKTKLEAQVRTEESGANSPKGRIIKGVLKRA